MNKKVKYISVDEVVKRYVDAKKPPTTEEKIRHNKFSIFGYVLLFFMLLTIIVVYFKSPATTRFLQIAILTSGIAGCFVCIWAIIQLYSYTQHLKRQQLLNELLSDKK